MGLEMSDLSKRESGFREELGLGGGLLGFGGGFWGGVVGNFKRQLGLKERTLNGVGLTSGVCGNFGRWGREKEKGELQTPVGLKGGRTELRREKIRC